MTSQTRSYGQLVRDLHPLGSDSENQQLQSEIQRLPVRAENQAAKGREENYRNELEAINREIADQRHRDEERVKQLMPNGEACGLFSIAHV
jgi:hypothetical protein